MSTERRKKIREYRKKLPKIWALVKTRIKGTPNASYWDNISFFFWGWRLEDILLVHYGTFWYVPLLTLFRKKVDRGDEGFVRTPYLNKKHI